MIVTRKGWRCDDDDDDGVRPVTTASTTVMGVTSGRW